MGAGYWEIEEEDLAVSRKIWAGHREEEAVHVNVVETETEEEVQLRVFETETEEEVHLTGLGTFVIPAQVRPLAFVTYLCAHFVPQDIRLIP